MEFFDFLNVIVLKLSYVFHDLKNVKKAKKVGQLSIDQLLPILDTFFKKSPVCLHQGTLYTFTYWHLELVQKGN
jgi:hypothetical protein